MNYTYVISVKTFLSISQDVHTIGPNGRTILIVVRTILVMVKTLARRKKTLILSVTRFMQLAYILKLVSGMNAVDLINAFRSGSIADTLWDLALGIFARLEADGITIAIEGVFVTLLLEWLRSAVGNKQLLRIGPIRVKV